ncbi:ephrin type-A receptor 4a-like isoform X2 [Dysidea avara]|uniref:ephrin type-A receptor 4a-like isoform X2 n=1 Tax=Dysidea avara TaxID=196820 RepID=UPI003326F97B
MIAKLFLLLCYVGLSYTVSSDESVSPGAAIGGTIGGLIGLVVLVVAIVCCARWKWRKNSSDVESSHNASHVRTEKSDNEGHSYSKRVPQPVRRKIAPGIRHQCSVVDKALSTMKANNIPLVYETPISISSTTMVNDPLSAAPYEIAVSMEAEQHIYETPCEDEEDYGPVYQKPPSDEQKIYEEFEGKRLCKLFHNEIMSFEELGAGEFGVVIRGMWTPSADKEVEVAVKSLNVDVIGKERVRFLQEAAIMCQFDHENVIKLYGVVTDAPTMIVLEYMSRGDLMNVLAKLQPRNGKPIREEMPLVLLKFCREIAAGMTYLSGKKFIHRDLAARNVLVSKDTTCKIADFGMSRDILDGNYYVTSGGKIPVKWTAPEAINYRKYSLFSDVWSYGCVLYEIWSLGYKPFESMHNDQVLETLETGYRLSPPPGCPRTIYRLMIRCWNPEPRSRPQFGQITKILVGNSSHLLRWTDEDKQIGGEDAMKLGSPLDCANNLYYDLQHKYLIQ